MAEVWLQLDYGQKLEIGFQPLPHFTHQTPQAPMGLPRALPLGAISLKVLILPTAGEWLKSSCSSPR